MKNTRLFALMYSLTYFILINPSYGSPLSGKNVRRTKAKELPFVVSIQLTDEPGSNFCVGTLISQQSVLTAAHCLAGFEFSDIVIMATSNSLLHGNLYKVESWISYDQWMNLITDGGPSRNDIAVITLDQKVEGSTSASILTFVTDDLYNSKVRIAGWGHPENSSKPMILRTAVFKVLSNEDCESKIESLLHKPLYVPENHFCTQADPWIHGDCGDSGAPILNKRNQVVGINRGVCPKNVTENGFFSEQFVKQNLVNVHLNLYAYRQFINDVKQ